MMSKTGDLELLPEGRSTELSWELLHGAIDIHVHAGPHLNSSPRRIDPFEAAREARDAGMRAIVLMDVFQMSTGTAWLVNRVIPDFLVFGGIILNTVFGGLNPRAVKTALYYGSGARFVCFGTHSTYYQASREGRTVGGEFKRLADLYPKFAQEELSRAIRIPLEDPVPPELDEILTLVARHPQVFLRTGHVSPAEALRLIDLAKKYGIKHVVLDSGVTKEMSIEQQKQAVAKGAFLEHTLASYTHTASIPKTHYYVEKEFVSIDEGMQGGAKGSLLDVARQIRIVGAEHCIMSTDFGVYTLPTPVEGLREFIACLLDLGITPEEVKMMSAVNPAEVLCLD
ncbi:MAG: DUF6282 family protein [Candidatus Methanomethyliaceae archaeon]